MERELMGDAAVQVMRSGYPIVLLRQGTKAPSFKAWNSRPPMTRVEVQTHTRRRVHNIGIDLREGLMVADCDTPEMLEWVLREFGETPTLARTSRGFHAYYRRAFEMRNRIHYLGKPLDLLVTVATAPPSWISKTEFRYEWARFAPAKDLPEIKEEQIREEPKPKTPCSKIVIEDVRTCRYAAAALRSEVQRVASAQEGTRNATLNRAAFSLGSLVATGLLMRDTVEVALTEAALSVGLGEAEVAATLHSGITAGLKRPRTKGT
jgi:hypothetical protein